MPRNKKKSEKKKTGGKSGAKRMKFISASSHQIFDNMKEHLDMGGNQNILKSYPEYEAEIFENRQSIEDNDSPQTEAEMRTLQQDKQDYLQQQQVQEIDAVNAVNRYRAKLHSNRKHEIINYCVVLIALFALLVSLLGFAYLSYQTNDGQVWDAPPPRANLEEDLFRITGFK